MRDFRDAKAMAQTLREALKSRSVDLSHSESLELTARMLGLRNWNVLAAKIQEAEEGRASPPAPAAGPPEGLPVIPLRDIVLFPGMTIPLFVGRAKSVRAVERAMLGDKRLLLVVQKQPKDDDPGPDALGAVGTIARVLDVMQLPDGNAKLVVSGEARARITRMTMGELLRADHEPFGEEPSGEEGEAVVQEVLAAYHVDMQELPQALLALRRIKAPGLLADVLIPHLAAGLDRAQDILETADPVERLRKVLAILQAGKKAA
jgi:ATP-dependent Lon protease